MAASMFNSGLRVIASKYDDKLLSLENLLCIVSSHVGILPRGAGNAGACKKNNNNNIKIQLQGNMM